jgi:hypothetical protein
MFFFPAETSEQAIADAGKGTLPLAGPLTITHAIRRAGEMILENCRYEGVTMFLEVDGRKMPELPERRQLEALLPQEKVLVNIDGKAYRANTEVFGFQQVYDDTVKVIEALKALGISQEALLILATPDEITIEVHPGVFGLPEDPSLAAKYRAFLFRIAQVKLSDRQVIKQGDRTILLDTAEFSATTLLPGSIHPTLHRSKVCVGPSHFAYGPAAFSDYCGKKRSTDECLKEIRAWVKFLESAINPVPAVNKLLTELATVPARDSTSAHAPGGSGTRGSTATTSAPGLSGGSAGEPMPTSGGFQPIKQEILQNMSVFPSRQPPIPTGFPELNKILGGGWKPKALHLLVAPREEGKTSFLLGQAVAGAGQTGVLVVSRESCFSEYLIRLLCRHHKLPMNEIVAKAALGTPEAPAVKEKLRGAVKACAAGIPDRLFFRGTDSTLDAMQADELSELLKLVPGTTPKLLFLDGYATGDLDAQPGFLRALREKAEQQNFAVIIGIHVPPNTPAKPHLIETTDLDWLQRWQEISDTILSLTSERTNLKKYLAITQGKVDPGVAEKLEQKLYQHLGSKRLRGDTYSFLRCLHARTGLRQMILYLYQRELQLFAEGPLVPLGRP